jgi:hypothetical protein
LIEFLRYDAVCEKGKEEEGRKEEGKEEKEKGGRGGETKISVRNTQKKKETKTNRLASPTVGKRIHLLSLSLLLLVVVVVVAFLLILLLLLLLF